MNIDLSEEEIELLIRERVIQLELTHKCWIDCPKNFAVECPPDHFLYYVEDHVGIHQTLLRKLMFAREGHEV